MSEPKMREELADLLDKAGHLDREGRIIGLILAYVEVPDGDLARATIRISTGGTNFPLVGDCLLARINDHRSEIIWNRRPDDSPAAGDPPA